MKKLPFFAILFVVPLHNENAVCSKLMKESFIISFNQKQISSYPKAESKDLPVLSIYF